MPVGIPVHLWASEFGGDGVASKDVETVARNLATLPEMHAAAKAGHLAFLAPCSAEFAEAAADFGEAEICADGAGFDRIAFHRGFNAEVLDFFRRHLGAGLGP